jgi:hypothetical protein
VAYISGELLHPIEGLISLLQDAGEFLIVSLCESLESGHWHEGSGSGLWRLGLTHRGQVLQIGRGQVIAGLLVRLALIEEFLHGCQHPGILISEDALALVGMRTGDGQLGLAVLHEKGTHDSLVVLSLADFCDWFGGTEHGD